MGAGQSLPETYHEYIAATVDEKGFEIPHGIAVHPDDTMTVLALAVPTTEAYLVMLSMWRDGAKEMIFALDRFTKEGQGTSLGDLMAGHHFVRGQSPRPFIVEYQYQPRIVRPMTWDNSHWNDALMRELASALLIARQ